MAQSDAPKPVYVRVFEYPNGYVGNFHRHRLAQLVYSVRGIASVISDGKELVVSPFQAVAIPAWSLHRVSATGNALLHGVFIDPHVYPAAIGELSQVTITPLLHELIKEAGKHYYDYDNDSIIHHMLNLVVELVDKEETTQPVQALPIIKNSRIRRAIKKCEFQNLSSNEISKHAAYSNRQFSRLFKQETGMTFRQWRAIYLVQHGMRHLGKGMSVTEAAEKLGFCSSSAFITVFKRHVGFTPALMKLAIKY
ncbi:MAG: hypothetical protein COA96_16675 [SAR86 cluster bacterium]|uniref:HTH araC/xylS-type domain-containing protein n=1 Tax=SAR86 cluster bacterium TaxID=2030880 RepID=A0A2A5AHB7_9GAMM|nr:MAG: hypothetical protein COA96_16675 [SAR86 cluster bacterium]